MRKSLNKVNETLINCLIWHFCFLFPDFYFPFQPISRKNRKPRAVSRPQAPRVLDRGIGGPLYRLVVADTSAVTLAKNGIQSLLHGFVLQR